MENLENHFEKKERNVENKEKEINEELKAAAKMERVDFLTKEIKTGNVLFQGVLNTRKNNEFSIEKQLQKTAEGIARDLPDILKK